MTASRVQWCKFCLAWHPIEAFRPFRTGGYRGICRAGEREEAARRGYGNKPVKYPDGVRRYNCADCGKPCEVKPQAATATRCPDCQRIRTKEIIRDFGARRVRQDRHKQFTVKKPDDMARQQCCDRCPWWAECVSLVTTPAPLKCAPGSGVEVVRPKASELQSNWRMTA